jgi:NADH-quinone oxidoreductase subunit K
MFFVQSICSLILFITGILGVVLNRLNILIIIMCIELCFLSINLNFIFVSVYLDDFYGQIFSLFVLTIIAAESAIGLALLIVFYRIKGNILLNNLTIIKG